MHRNFLTNIFIMKNFNKTLLFFIAIIAISFSSCKKEPNILGTWMLFDTKLEFTTSNPLYTVLLNEKLGDTGKDVIECPEKIILNADGTGVYHASYQENGTFTYTKTANKITINGDFYIFDIGSLSKLELDYELLDKNSTLKVKYDATDYIKPILQMLLESYLNNPELSLPIDIDIDIDDVETVINSISKINVVAIYKK